MEFSSGFRTLIHTVIRRSIVIMGAVVAVILMFQCSSLPYRNLLISFATNRESVPDIVLSNNSTVLNNSRPSKNLLVHSSDHEDENYANDRKIESGTEIVGTVMAMGDDWVPRQVVESGSGFQLCKGCNSEKESNPIGISNTERDTGSIDGTSTREEFSQITHSNVKMGHSTELEDDIDLMVDGEEENVKSPVTNFSSSLKTTEFDGKEKNATCDLKCLVGETKILKRLDRQRISLSDMNSILKKSLAAPVSKRPKRSSFRDRELLSAKLEIVNAPVARDIPGLETSVFRNISHFKRSYELMESMLKVYVYKEGEKPIFHQPKMRGIYASEGWFMKLMEGNKKFVVRDPRKAHLFYLPFSSQRLRSVLEDQKLQSHKDLEKILKSYIDLIAGKYRFWNRTRGADHFLVACHDWAPKMTREHMGNCIRTLCNANVARDFKIGKDSTLPVTYIRSANDPVRDIGGKPPSERPILAFFAGGMHGYLRPILRQYWENKEPDMIIFGPMARDIEGKRIYREYMKSSKYCICARGYEVHTPRVVEAIFYECVPVIISDNYVPPFFETLNWEAFSVFVAEKDVPNLRNILLSIPEEEYLKMQRRVKMVQQHFIWHKQPVKYDLFHMILHSVWHNRIFQIRTR